ncbi:hypothetical protein [Streptomyces albicerus]|uniref:hypothetical protein n=1 Tax=Streptomyces albicerus TaxID=2569859 RepID=UPI00124B46E0|nr:hypothetical protein [Streptomyces albicerus]
MTDELLSLTSFCPPEAEAPARRDRGPRGVGRAPVPESHLRLSHAYGAGCFDEFLWVFAGSSENEYLDIEAATAQTQSVLRSKQIPEVRYALREFEMVPERLIQWGVTDNADVLLWIPAGDPEDWPTVVLQAGQLDFVVARRSSTGLVLDLMTRALRIPFFPDDFPSSRPRFSAKPWGGGDRGHAHT